MTQTLSLLLLLLALSTPRCADAQLAEWDDRRAVADTVLIAEDGHPVRLGDWRGKVVLIDFWGKWCSSCMQEMDSLKRLQQSLADRGDAVAFLFVSVDRAHFAADTAWFKTSGLAGANYRWDKRTSEQYHAFFRTSNAKWWVPDTVILDPDGNIAKWVLGGGTDWTHYGDFLRGLIP
jgi:thiol-disulfide isomerase/thioredoxin